MCHLVGDRGERKHVGGDGESERGGRSGVGSGVARRRGGQRR